MRILMLLTLVCVAAPATGAELCLSTPPVGGYYCCGGFPPCDFLAPMDWIGFRTDAAPCQDFELGAYAALTLSTSLHNPYLNTGPIPSHGRLYLWNVGEGGNFHDWGGFTMHVAGDIAILGYEPIAEGTVNAWDPSTGTLRFDACPGLRPNVVGAFVVGPGTIAVDGETWGRMKAVYR